MARPSSLSPALVTVRAATVIALVAGLTGLVAALGAGASAAEERPDGDAPLHARVSRSAASRPAAAAQSPLKLAIDSINPSVIPRSGPIRVSGSVTNRDDVEWRAINVYPFAASEPITTTADLTSAADSNPVTPVGDRITTPGYFDSVGDLAPGETVRFSLSVPRSALVVPATGEPIHAPGVYWFGVHALGESDAGRDTNADGRARTFMPLMPAEVDRPVKTALVIPLRRDVAYAGDGSLEDVAGWTRSLSPGGTLRQLVDFGAAAGSRPVSWLLDPALPDAVRQLVAGNPAHDLGPTPADEGDGAGGESPSADPTAEVEPGTDPTEEGADSSEPDPDLAAAADAGTAWLDRLHEALDGSEILALPYGDLDVSAAAQRDPDLIDRARARSGDVLEPWGLRMTPAVGSPSGFLDRVGIGAVDPDTTMLVTDRMFGADPPGVANTAGHKLVLTSSGAASGGPPPGDRLTTVALRQRILAEAALRVLNPGVKPLVVVLPPGWTPPSSTGFFEGLDVDWLQLTDVADAGDRTPTSYDLADLKIPRRQGALELDAANFVAVDALIQAGEALQNVLTKNTRIAGRVADQALTDVSYSSRGNPDAARVRADRSRLWIGDRLATIQISAPRGVTLSSASGRFATTITNGLDQPVTVHIDARIRGSEIVIKAPAKFDIPANSRRTVLLSARTDTPGVHNVTLVLTDCPEDPDNPTVCTAPLTPLGSSDELPIRSAQVSKVIWLIIGAGAAMLFGAILVRLVRRLRRARRPDDTAADPASEPDATTETTPETTQETTQETTP